MRRSRAEFPILGRVITARVPCFACRLPAAGPQGENRGKGSGRRPACPATPEEPALPAIESQLAKRNPWRVVAAALIIAAGAAFVAGVEYVTQTDAQATEQDFIEFWAMGQQLERHASPYDVSAIVQLERNAGLGANQPRISLSPPAVLFPMLPLGLMRPKTGRIAWFLVLIGCLALSLWLLWRLHGRPDNRLHVLGFAFAPAIVCLISGQLSIFLLTGIVLFCYFYRSWPTLAGAALLPCALKPHLFLVFALVLLIWAIYQRAFRVLAGFTAALLLSCAVTLYFDPRAWPQYFAMMGETRVMQSFIPTFGVALRFLIDRNAVGLQFVPLAVGSLWALWYFWTRRSRWDWMDQGLILLVVSDVCAPYGYFTDECILLPFVLAGLYAAAESKRSLVPLAVIDAAAIIEVYAQVNIISPYYLWTVPAWVGWYLYATGKRRGTAKPAESTAATVRME
jgi:hypothetical protein